MIRVEVDRRRWLVGDDANSVLYRPSDRKMCCLGFVARALGARVSEISSRETPAACEGVVWPYTLVEVGDWDNALPHNSSACIALMDYNDDSDLPPDKRERKIAEAGTKAGIEFVFVGEYPGAGAKKVGAR